MKRLSLLVAAMYFYAALATASPVTSARARKIAGVFLNLSPAEAVMLKESRSAIKASAAGAPAYYIFGKEDKGFVIIAGDDCLVPILGYSDTHLAEAERIPPAMLVWLSQVSEAARFARSAGLEPSAEAARMWDMVPIAAESAGTVLELPSWYQAPPYNWYCPTFSPYDNGKSVTGCVATAIGMVMWYHRWPPCGHGKLPDYQMYFFRDADGNDYVKVDIPGHTLGHEYKWSEMPGNDISYDSQREPTEAEKQVAWLLYDCGIMMRANYSADGTGAYSSNIPGKMANYMFYQKTAKYLYKRRYSSEVWMQMLKGQIDAGLPVIYGADSSAGGHQFVVCGYDSEDNLYVNWGWGGYYNGFYPLDNFFPYKDKDLSYLLEQGYTQEEIDDILDGGRFTKSHDAIFDLVPDRSASPRILDTDEPVPYVVELENPAKESDLCLTTGEKGSRRFSGISVYSGSLTYGSAFMAEAGLVCNNSETGYKGYFRFDQTDWTGNKVCTLGVADGVKYINPGDSICLSDIVCTASCEFRLGDKIALCTSSSKDGEYKIVNAADDGVTASEIPLVPMYFINPDGSDTLINGNEAYTSVKWKEENGKKKAVITYRDGSVETIVSPN